METGKKTKKFLEERDTLYVHTGFIVTLLIFEIKNN